MAELTAADLENLHKIVEEHFHLTLGTKERGILDAIANRPSQRAYGEEPFPDVYTKAASIMEGIIRWHPFVDGNKRTALVAVSAYLDINGYILVIPLSAVRFTVLVAKNTKTDARSNKKLIKKIAKWIKKYSADKEDDDDIQRAFNKVKMEYVWLLYAGKSIVLRKIATAMVHRSLAIDIYPEYEHEIKDITTFLTNQLQHNISEAAKSRSKK